MRLLLPFLLALAACAEDTRPMVVVQPDGVTSEVQPCASGCAAPTADERVDFTDAEIAGLLADMAHEPLGSANIAVETLLFHGADTVDYLNRTPATPLDASRLAWLRTELDRDTVKADFRLVGADGAVFGSIGPTFSLVTKQHLRLEAGDFGRVSINGKVKRVGVDHLWARF